MRLHSRCNAPSSDPLELLHHALDHKLQVIRDGASCNLLIIQPGESVQHYACNHITGEISRTAAMTHDKQDEVDIRQTKQTCLPANAHVQVHGEGAHGEVVSLRQCGILQERVTSPCSRHYERRPVFEVPGSEVMPDGHCQKTPHLTQQRREHILQDVWRERVNEVKPVLHQIRVSACDWMGGGGLQKLWALSWDIYTVPFLMPVHTGSVHLLAADLLHRDMRTYTYCTMQR